MDVFGGAGSRMLAGPSGPGQEDWMTFTFRLEQADGTPAEPPTIESTVTNWRVGDTIPIRRDRTLRVVAIVVSKDDEPSDLVVEDVAERASSAEL
jgi:hypothetical protein